MSEKDSGQMSCSTHAGCVSLVPIFNHLGEEEMDEIATVTQSKSFKKGSYLYQPNEVSETLYILHSGWVRVFRMNESGKEQLVRFLKPGDFMGEMAVFSPRLHEGFAEAIKDTTVCMIRKKDLEELLQKYPAISLKIMEEFSERLENSEKQTTLVATEKVEVRLATFLVELMEQEHQEVTLPMSKKDLASYLGTTPETLSRKFGVLEDRGLIQALTNRKIRIVDADELLLL